MPTTNLGVGMSRSRFTGTAAPARTSTRRGCSRPCTAAPTRASCVRVDGDDVEEVNERVDRARRLGVGLQVAGRPPDDSDHALMQVVQRRRFGRGLEERVSAAAWCFFINPNSLPRGAVRPRRLPADERWQRAASVSFTQLDQFGMPIDAGAKRMSTRCDELGGVRDAAAPHPPRRALRRLERGDARRPTRARRGRWLSRGSGARAPASPLRTRGSPARRSRRRAPSTAASRPRRGRPAVAAAAVGDDGADRRPPVSAAAAARPRRPRRRPRRLPAGSRGRADARWRARAPPVFAVLPRARAFARSARPPRRRARAVPRRRRRGAPGAARRSRGPRSPTPTARAPTAAAAGAERVVRRGGRCRAPRAPPGRRADLQRAVVGAAGERRRGPRGGGAARFHRARGRRRRDSRSRRPPRGRRARRRRRAGRRRPRSRRRPLRRRARRRARARRRRGGGDGAVARPLDGVSSARTARRRGGSGVLLPPRADLFAQLGVAPRGVLLVGPPGVGKTASRRAAAAAARASAAAGVIEVRCADIVGNGVGGRGPSPPCSRPRGAPCVLLLDQLEALAPPRVAAGLEEARSTARSRALIEMDGLLGGRDSDAAARASSVTAASREQLDAILQPGRSTSTSSRAARAPRRRHPRALARRVPLPRSPTAPSRPPPEARARAAAGGGGGGLAAAAASPRAAAARPDALADATDGADGRAPPLRALCHEARRAARERT